ncbi:unnamed protein product, partial [Meganyctiphanes norvegica]
EHSSDTSSPSSNTSLIQMPEQQSTGAYGGVQAQGGVYTTALRVQQDNTKHTTDKQPKAWPLLKRLKTFIILCVLVLCMWLTYSDSESVVFHLEPAKRLPALAHDVPSCSPKNHIMFLKTHKCASSTVQNIFLRYGYKNNLTFALPIEDNYLGNGKHFKASMLPKVLTPPSGKVDIFAVHTRLEPSQHRQVLPDDTIWLTVVRDPTTLYESLFNFFRMAEPYGYNISLDSFSEIPLEKLLKLPRLYLKFGKNQMLFDFGYNEDIPMWELQEVIHDIDSLFHIVLVAEYLEESLILMKHLLCWSLHDIVFFTKNARTSKFKHKLSYETMRVIRKVNSADVLLYDHFLAKHREAVLKFGLKRMKDELAELRALRDEYHEDCGIREVNGKDSRLDFPEYSFQVEAYLVNNTDETCQLMSLPELPFLDKLRLHQRASLIKKNG